MRFVLGFLLIVLVFSVMLIGGGVVICILPLVGSSSVELGTIILIWTVACVASVYFLKVALETVPTLRTPEIEDDDDEDDEAPEVPPEVVRPPLWILPPTARPPGK